MKPNARVFAISEGEVAVGPSTVVTGQISITNTTAYVLIDSGASHSFIAGGFVKKLDRKPDDLAQPFVTATPSGETMQSRFWFRDVPIFLSGRELAVNLVVLEMRDFDSILGMDWLSKYHATIDCKRKSVLFRPSGAESFEFKGSPKGLTIPLVSALQARKMLDGGCQGFLAHNRRSVPRGHASSFGYPGREEFPPRLSRRPSRVTS